MILKLEQSSDEQQLGSTKPRFNNMSDDVPFTNPTFSTQSLSYMNGHPGSLGDVLLGLYDNRAVTALPVPANGTSKDLRHSQLTVPTNGSSTDTVNFEDAHDSDVHRYQRFVPTDGVSTVPGAVNFGNDFGSDIYQYQQSNGYHCQEVFPTNGLSTDTVNIGNSFDWDSDAYRRNNSNTSIVEPQALPAPYGLPHFSTLSRGTLSDMPFPANELHSGLDINESPQYATIYSPRGHTSTFPVTSRAFDTGSTKSSFTTERLTGHGASGPLAHVEEDSLFAATQFRCTPSPSASSITRDSLPAVVETRGSMISPFTTVTTEPLIFRASTQEDVSVTAPAYTIKPSVIISRWGEAFFVLLEIERPKNWDDQMKEKILQIEPSDASKLLDRLGPVASNGLFVCECGRSYATERHAKHNQ